MVSGGIVEGLSDKVFCSIVRDFKARLGGLKGLPENHDVARAVRHAQIQALERLILDYFEIGRPEWANDDSAEPQIFQDKALDFCKKAIGRYNRRAPIPDLDLSSSLVASIDGILAPPANEGPAEQRAGAVAAIAEDAVLDELRDVLGGVQLPDGFEDHFRYGNDGRGSFLELFGRYVAEEVKENDRFRNILTVGKLAGIEALAFDTAELVRRLDERFGSALDALQATAAETRADVAEIRSTMSELVRHLSRSESVPLETLRAILREMGDSVQGANAAEISERLRAKAREFKALTERLDSLTSQDPAIAQHRIAATEALAAGEFSKADAELAEAESKALAEVEAQEQRAKESRLSAAEVRAERAAIAMLRDNPKGYADAAAHFGEAATIARPADAAVADAYHAKEKDAESLGHAARTKALAVLLRRKRKTG
jgi:hypothetical protein